MALNFEVLFTSEASGQLWNTCVWDINSGTHLSTYKGGSSSPRTMCTLKQDYLIAGVSNKPLIHVWTLQKREQIQQRMVCPGHLTALASSPDGLYVAGAVQDKIHVWQVSTGNLMAVLHKHYQTVRCLRFTDDGSHFVSGGDDNLVLVWPLWKVLDLSNSGPVSVEPRHTWSQHSLPITDVHVGMGGIQSRVFTASLDQTCKVFNLSSGQLLLNLIFDCGITAIMTDSTETKLYAGCHNGKIYTVNLHTQPTKSEVHISGDDANEMCKTVFAGHSKQVSCMCMSLDSSILISGSHDQSVRIWDVHSGQCVKTLPHKGAVTNVMMALTPPGIVNSDYRAKHPIQPFKRFLHNSEQSTDQHGQDSGTISVILTGNQDEEDNLEATVENYIEFLENMEEEEEAQGKSENKKVQLEQEVQKLRTVNKQIYDFAIQKIISDNT